MAISCTVYFFSASKGSVLTAVEMHKFFSIAIIIAGLGNEWRCVDDDNDDDDADDVDDDKVDDDDVDGVEDDNVDGDDEDDDDDED